MKSVRGIMVKTWKTFENKIPRKYKTQALITNIYCTGIFIFVMILAIQSMGQRAAIRELAGIIRDQQENINDLKGQVTLFENKLGDLENQVYRQMEFIDQLTLIYERIAFSSYDKFHFSDDQIWGKAWELVCGSLAYDAPLEYVIAAATSQSFQNYSVQKIGTSFKQVQGQIDQTPTIWPVYGRISSKFGSRIHPIYKKHHFHQGIDIAVDTGTSIYATASGRVSYASFSGGYGWVVIINHGSGIQTLYAHNSKLLVEQGQWVQKGEVIALSGQSGVATGPHLHYEVMISGKRVNPIAYMWQDFETPHFEDGSQTPNIVLASVPSRSKRSLYSR